MNKKSRHIIHWHRWSDRFDQRVLVAWDNQDWFLFLVFEIRDSKHRFLVFLKITKFPRCFSLSKIILTPRIEESLLHLKEQAPFQITSWFIKINHLAWNVSIIIEDVFNLFNFQNRSIARNEATIGKKIKIETLGALLDTLTSWILPCFSASNKESR